VKSIALFGGSFNPIHYGHLAIAEEVRTKFNLDKVFFVPCSSPPHKDGSDLADPRHRVVMTYLATVSNPSFEVSSFEADRGGKSYTIDTVRHFHQLFQGKAQIHFIVGADMLTEIFSWKNIEELLALCRFIAVPRPGYDLSKIMNYHFLGSENFSRSSALLENVIVGDSVLLDISATNIRQRVREWKSIKYLVPEAVEQFIHNQRLYL
jgi:nicotinate-nucleotide adenylyltransferase